MFHHTRSVKKKASSRDAMACILDLYTLLLHLLHLGISSPLLGVVLLKNMGVWPGLNFLAPSKDRLSFSTGNGAFILLAPCALAVGCTSLHTNKDGGCRDY